jgi:RNA polymerase sigma-54 factor
MKLRQVIAQRPTVTPQLVMARTLLQLSSTELEQAIARELAENPALEMVETPRCPSCGAAMPHGHCPYCGKSTSQVEREYGADNASYDYAYDGDDAISRLSTRTSLGEHLLSQARLSLSSQDLPIAAHLLENLDHHGFLRCELDEVASQFGIDQAHVEDIVSSLQELEPAGIAARDARECLLIQIEHLHRQGIEQPLAQALVAEHWEALSKQPLAEVAKIAGATVDQIQAALAFIRDNLNPFPAHAHWAALHESPPPTEAVYPQPDIVIKNGETEYQIELPRAQSYRLRISPSFLEVMRTCRANRVVFTEQDVEEWKAFYAQARMFINSIGRRWQTLQNIARHLIEYQGDFLAHGGKHLKPLTRAQLAETMGVHESTVSRAVAGKYVQLPNGKIIPLAKFFDSATPAKETIKELIAQETKPLSDQELVELLGKQGYHVARRTVAKYREALHIPPSPVRRRNRQISHKQPDMPIRSIEN